MAKVERKELRPGYTYSRLLKGGWHLSSGHNESVERNQAIKDMAAFVEAGITSFDCADHYLGVEQMIGDFRRAYPDLGKNVQVHTKYVPYFNALTTVKPEDTEAIIDRSLKRLSVDTLDLVQFYWWDWAKGRPVDAALTLKKLQAKGKIRYIGVTNFTTAQLKELVDAGVPIAANQQQYSLVDNRAERQQLKYCIDNNIHVLTYGHLLGGFMATSWLGVPEPVEPYANRSLRKYKLIIEDFGPWALYQELLGTLSRIGQRLGVGPGEVALRWTLDQPGIGGCIVGATSTKYLNANLKVFDIVLTDADRAALTAVTDRRQGPEGDCYELEGDAEGRHGRIMRRNQNVMDDAPWPPAKAV